MDRVDIEERLDHHAYVTGERVIKLPDSYTAKPKINHRDRHVMRSMSHAAHRDSIKPANYNSRARTKKA